MTSSSTRIFKPVPLRTINWQRVFLKAQPLLILIAGLSLTYLLQHIATNHMRQLQQDDFLYQTHDISLRIDNRLANYEQVLRSIQGIFISSDKVEANEFHRYIENLPLAEMYPGIHAVGYSQILTTNSKTAHLKSGSYPSYSKITPLAQSERDIRSTIVYIDQFKPLKQLALGDDLYRNELSRSAMQQARDLNKAMMTDNIPLKEGSSQDAEKQTGFLMYLPVYRHDSPTHTLAQRRANLVGWVFAQFEMRDLMSGILGDQVRKIDINIFNANSARQRSLIYDSDMHYATSQNSASLYSSTKTVEFHGQNWNIEYLSLPDLENDIDNERILVITTTGILLSLILSLLVYQTGKIRRRSLDNIQDLRIAATVFESREGMFVTDADHNILRVNRAFSRITGYSAAEAVGKNPRILRSGRQNQKFYARMWESINDTGTWEGELWNRCKEGRIYSEYLTITAVKDKNDRIMNYVATFSDITERKKVELALAKEQSRLKDAQRIAQMGSWQYDLTTGELKWSDELYRICGASVETLTLNFESWMARIHAEDKICVNEWINACISGNKPGAIEYRCIWPDGTIRHVEVNGQLFFDANGNAIHISGTAQDISRRKQTELRLRESEERLSLATRAAGIGIWDWDIVSNTLVWDDLMFRLYGLKRNQFSSNYEAWRQCLHPDDRTRCEQAIDDALKHLVPFNLEFRVIHADGSIHHIKTYSQTTCNEHGEAVRMVGVNWDITPQKNLEFQQADSLLRMKKNEEAKTRFLAAAGHDLRQPVAAASLFLYALKLTSPSPAQTELLDQLTLSMKNFSDLLERLLDISKFDAGLIKPELSTFNLAEIFSFLSQTFEKSSLEKSLKLHFHYPEHRTLRVRSDIVLLKSVLMNLVSNALKFTTEGGILISARPRGDKVLMQVWDTGIGIEEENIAHIFDEFYQVSNPQRSREGGLGLGLSICQRAMSLLGSDVICHSRPGRGSVFEILLPLDGKPPKSTKAKSDTSLPAIEIREFVRGKSIVVLEDDQLVAAGLVTMLTSLGATVRHFSNAAVALHENNFANTDYFIADYSLQGELSGLDFLLTLQKRQNKFLHAVIITGETSSQFMLKVADSPWPILHKPINFPMLASKLQAYAATNTQSSVPEVTSVKKRK